MELDRQPLTPLMRHARDGRVDLLPDLILRGFDVNAGKSWKAGGGEGAGMTALHVACEHGQYEAARFLLEHGARVNIQAFDPSDDRGGATPISLAAAGGHSRIVLLLLAHGADGSSGMRMRAREQDVLLLFCASNWWSSPVSYPLHYVEHLSAERVECALRDGRDPCHLPAAPMPAHVREMAARIGLTVEPAYTPLETARRLCERGALPGSAAHVIVAATQPWSPANAHLFPRPARARALELLLAGCALGARLRASDESAFRDVWVGCVMPLAIDRSVGPGGRRTSPLAAHGHKSSHAVLPPIPMAPRLHCGVGGGKTGMRRVAPERATGFVD